MSTREDAVTSSFYSEGTTNINESYNFDEEVGPNEFQLENIPVDTLDKSPIVQEPPSLLKPVILCLIISFTGFIFGWDIGTIGGIINMQIFKKSFGNKINPETSERYFDPTLSGLIIGIYNIGAGIGGLTLGKLGDYRGRKMALGIAMCIHLLGLFTELVEDYSWIQFFIGRLLTGIAIGTTAVIVPMYLCENSPLKIRGAMVVLYQLMITLGILTGNISNFICHNIYNDSEDNRAWQVPILLNVFWDSIVFIGLFFIPESAIYLGKLCFDMDGAQKSFAKMNGVAETDRLSMEFINDIKLSAEIEKEENNETPKLKFEFIFGKPKLGYRLLIGILIMTFQQLSGINYFFYYGTTIFKNVGFEDSYLTAIILSLVNFVSTFGGIYLVEQIGRRTCYLLGCLSLNIFMILFASIGNFAINEPYVGVGLIFIVCLYIFFFAITLGPVSFVLVSELFPSRVKAESIAICSFFNWIMNFLVSLVMPLILSRVGFLCGYIFSGFLTIGFIFSWQCVPETKGLTEKEIDDIYQDVKQETH
ncbi:hypothetical protein TBLA_0H00240 [Henningerozyma blattae CBS 6284]|uniref:Major facilitator superfamily (MFS) profile domain-containing protein n=1 Tax=Henningerozyma blattae (strain ATCC 34711 / CBS 6284 / DSM 70876 / NBRC 10599 / NRRL Y-10934 / UCD 77-7) TaxID=1071380 RepID=I2H7G5_HENB6|nr:hypothetical protein TBLA_0H00240 [Tetrapisispora blattae CBS 6284]CCH62317.1 hypothetical protein TBLA_0H00240 [Tetrapisispora blattae CBS 6284]